MVPIRPIPPVCAALASLPVTTCWRWSWQTCAAPSCMPAPGVSGSVTRHARLRPVTDDSQPKTCYFVFLDYTWSVIRALDPEEVEDENPCFRVVRRPAAGGCVRRGAGGFAVRGLAQRAAWRAVPECESDRQADLAGKNLGGGRRAHQSLRSGRAVDQARRLYIQDQAGRGQHGRCPRT